MKDVYSHTELIDSIFTDLNTMQKEQMSGQYIQAASVFVGIVQKLLTLRKSVDNDLKNRDETIENLKEQLRNAGIEVVDMPIEEAIE